MYKQFKYILKREKRDKKANIKGYLSFFYLISLQF